MPSNVLSIFLDYHATTDPPYIQYYQTAPATFISMINGYRTALATTSSIPFSFGYHLTTDPSHNFHYQTVWHCPINIIIRYQTTLAASSIINFCCGYHPTTYITHNIIIWQLRQHPTSIRTGYQTTLALDSFGKISLDLAILVGANAVSNAYSLHHTFWSLGQKFLKLKIGLVLFVWQVISASVTPVK